MPKLPMYFDVTVYEADGTTEDFILSSFPDDELPYIFDPPNGDGESFDPVSGEPTTGSYSVTVADPETSTDTRVVTSRLADASARQQLLMRKARVRKSADGTTWTTLVIGYLTRISLITAIEFELAIGQSRRIEKSTTVFKEATDQFPGVTSVIGGPVYGGFISSDFLEDYGGWHFEVDEDTAVHTKLALIEGFDPRKPLDSGGSFDTFTSTSTAVADFTNDWARSYFEPTSAYAASDIIGYFPGLRARLEPVLGGDAVTLIPLARPKTGVGVWYNPAGSGGDKLTGFGTSQLYLPKEGVEDDGTVVAFDPSIGTEYMVYVYAVAVSDQNPMHWYGHPVDLWEAFRIDAGIAYDASVLPALKALVGEQMRVAIRAKSSLSLSDADQKIIYGPFRLSSRIEDGEEILFSTDTTNNDVPADTITLSMLRGDGGTVFDLDEGTVTTAVTVKTQRITKWTSDDANQPEIDGLISRPTYPESIENSDDDIPPGTKNEQVLGDIPGMIFVDGAGPINMETFLTFRGYEMFERFGRGAITVELDCLPSVTNVLGEEVLLDLPHLPGAVVGETPVSQRQIAPQPYQIVQRTESPEGPFLKLVNSLSGELADSVLPTFTVEDMVGLPEYGLVTITNADDLAADDLNCRCDYAVNGAEPDEGAGTHFITILASQMVGATYAFTVGPVEGGAVLWIQLRAEAPGFRPGAWTAWDSATLEAP
jgi:hypothetical protein